MDDAAAAHARVARGGRRVRHERRDRGHTVLVGAPGRDGTAIGLGKLKSDKVEADVGAAYAYTRPDVSEEFTLFEQLEPATCSCTTARQALSLSNTTCLVSPLAKYDAGPREGFEEAAAAPGGPGHLARDDGLREVRGRRRRLRIGWKYQDAAGSSGGEGALRQTRPIP